MTKEEELNDLKEQILKDGNTLVSKRDLLERFCEIDKEYNGRPWNLLQILSNINILIGEEPSSQKWIPITYRKPTQEEKDDYYAQYSEELCYVAENEMPLDGQEVLVSCSGIVSIDTFDKGYYDFEYMSIEDVDAWMPLPKSYKAEKKFCSDCKHHTDAEEIHGVTPCGSCGVDKKNFEQKGARYDKGRSDKTVS